MIDKKKKDKISLHKGDKNELSDYKTDNCIILYMVIRTNMHIFIPIGVVNVLNVKKNMILLNGVWMTVKFT